MIKKTPKPIVFVKNTLKLCTKGVFWLIFLLLLIVLVVFYQQNKTAGNPLFVQSLPHTAQDKTPLYVVIDPKRHKDSQALIDTFSEHRPDIELIIAKDIPKDKNHIILGDPPTEALTSFDYALKDEAVLVGYMSGDDTASLAFRDFLLSSVAQDMLINDGFDSIEPYRDLSDYFATPQENKKTADKTAAHAVSATALITAP